MVAINTELLEMFLQRNYVPVVSPVGFLDDGSTLPSSPTRSPRAGGGGQGLEARVPRGRAGLHGGRRAAGQITTTVLKAKIEQGVFSSNLARKAALGHRRPRGGRGARARHRLAHAALHHRRVLHRPGHRLAGDPWLTSPRHRARRELIRRVLRTHLVGTQEELGELLEREGIEVTQATL